MSKSLKPELMNEDSSTIDAPVKLPFWFKTITQPDLVVRAKAEHLSPELMSKIVQALKEHKTVVLMSGDQPLKVTMDEGRVKVTPIPSPEYESK